MFYTIITHFQENNFQNVSRGIYLHNVLRLIYKHVSM